MKKIYLTEIEKERVSIDNIVEVLSEALDSAAMECGAMGTEPIDVEIYNLPVQIDLPVTLPLWKNFWWEWGQNKSGTYLFVSASEE